jgi:chemotaxis protein MotB
MKHLKTIAVLAIGSFLFTSCGPNKKLTAANAENARLNSVVTEQAGKLAANDKEIARLKTENIQYGKEAEECRQAKAAVTQKLDNLHKNLAEQGTSMKELQAKIQGAIEKLLKSGATVAYENGQVHVNYPENFFFKTNSFAIGDKGKEALNAVADVMKENPRLTAIVEGNTDTVSIKGKADNWTLSTERANAVVRVLHKTYDIDPSRLTSAGRSKFNPIADNSTPEGREKNRRIEIILVPDPARMAELMAQ